MVLEPRFVRGFTLTGDWYSIDIGKAIQSIGPQTILNSCYRDPVSKYCELVHRDATGRIASIDNDYLNIGGQRAAGIDVGARYDLSSLAGDLAASVDLSWLQRMDFELSDGKVLHAKGVYSGSTALFSALQATGRLSWRFRGASAGVAGRLVGSYKMCDDGDCSTPNALSREVPAYATWDLFLGYTLKSVRGTSSVLLGVNNVLNQAPPLLYDSTSNNSNPSTYDFVGRYAYLKLSHAL